MPQASLLFLAGMYALQLSSFVPASDQRAALLVASIVCVVLRRLRSLGCLLAGACIFANGVSDGLGARIAPELVGDSLLVTVSVAHFASVEGELTSFVAAPAAGSRVSGRLRLSWFRAPVELRLGDVWRLELRLRRPRGNSNPGGFDAGAWLLREGVTATGYVVNSRRNHLLRAGPGTLLDRLRLRFVERLSQAGIDADAAAVLAALVVGARHGISDAQWERYARSGTTHLMAISGLHIGLAALGGYLLACALLAATGSRCNHHLAAVAGSVITAVAYATLSGLAVPAQRACLMIALASLALLRRRPPRIHRVVLLAALLLGVLTPLASLQPGFGLSFAAVAILLWFGSQGRVAAGGGRVLRRTAQLGKAQLMLLAGLLPLTVAWFDRVSLAAPLVNFVAVPVFSALTVPLALLGLLLDGPLQAPGDLALQASAASIAAIDRLIAIAAAAPGASARLPGLAGGAVLLALLPLAWVVLPPGWPGRYLAWLALVALLAYVPPRPAPGCAAVHVLDVGQGLAVLVETRAAALLYDTGPAYRAGGGAAATVIVPFLQYRGIRRIDRLVVTHADLDHAGGVDTVLAAVPVRTTLVGEMLQQGPDSQRPCRAGDAWQSNGVRFRFLHPPQDHSLAGNDASCVLLLEAGRHRVLLTGDIEAAAEARLVNAAAVPAVSAVVVPHHGSKTSSSAAFVAALRAELAVVSAGFGNRWGLPAAAVVARWQDNGARVVTTAESGAVTLMLCRDAESIALSEYRRERRRIWVE